GRRVEQLDARVVVTRHDLVGLLARNAYRDRLAAFLFVVGDAVVERRGTIARRRHPFLRVTRGRLLRQRAFEVGYALLVEGATRRPGILSTFRHAVVVPARLRAYALRRWVVDRRGAAFLRVPARLLFFGAALAAVRDVRRGADRG